MRIQAAVARAPHADLSLETLELDAPRADEIVVRIVATGLCHTDIAMRNQTYPVPQPIVLGHEGAGVVVAIGAAVSKVAVGDHVVMSFDSCGSCASCRGQQPNYCADFFNRNFAGRRADGSLTLRCDSPAGAVHGSFFGQSSFASHALCRERNVVRVPQEAPLELLGPLACGLQTGAGAVINSFRLRPGQTIAVFGAGSVGLAAVMAASLAGATCIIVIDPQAPRRDMALSLGAHHALDPLDPAADVVAALLAILPDGVDFSFDSTGSGRVARQAVEVLAHRGTCGIVGASAPGEEVSLDLTHIMTAGRSLRGIVEGDARPDEFIPTLIELHRQGRFPFDRLVRFYPLSAINEAIADSEAGRTIKAILRMPA